MSKNNQNYLQNKLSAARKLRDSKYRVISHFLTINFRRTQTAFIVAAR